MVHRCFVLLYGLQELREEMERVGALVNNPAGEACSVRGSWRMLLDVFSPRFDVGLLLVAFSCESVAERGVVEPCACCGWQEVRLQVGIVVLRE